MAKGGAVSKSCQCCSKQKLVEGGVGKLKYAAGGDVSGYKTHWKSEKSGDKDITHATVTHDSSGHDNPDKKHVARFTFFNSDNQGGAHHVASHVDEAHRRKGLASSHYKEYQDRTGAKLAPHQDHQTDDAKALWANKKFAAGGSVTYHHQHALPKDTHVPAHHSDPDDENGKYEGQNHRLSGAADVHYAVKNKRVVGHVAQDDEGRVQGVYIDPEHRRQGIARNLYKHVAKTTGKIKSDAPEAMEPEAKAMWSQMKQEAPDKVSQGTKGFMLKKAQGGSVKKSQGPLGLNLNDFKHVHSDDKATTLKHKNGHELRIAHNSIEPKMANALKALGSIGKENATSNQAQESQDQAQYGKVIMKAEGGGVWDKVKDAFAGDFGEANKAAEDSQKAAQGRKKTNEAPKQGAQQGGGQSSGWGYAEGGNVQRKMYAEGDDDIKASPETMDEAKSLHEKLDSIGHMLKRVISSPHIDAKGKQSYDDDDQAPPQDQTQDQPDQVQAPQPQMSSQPAIPQDPNANMSQGAPASVNAPMNPPDATAAQNAPPVQAAPITGSPQQIDPKQQMVQRVQQDPTTPAAVRNAHPDQQAQYGMRKQELMGHYDQAVREYQDDMANGHITPKTYNDLMYYKQDENGNMERGADGNKVAKSTLGQIVSAFRMFAHQVGSGLTGQPNAMLTMMDNQIKNDFEAQKTSKTNAYNFLNMQREHELSHAQSVGEIAEANLKAQTLAQIKGYQSGMDALVKDYQASFAKDPNSPETMQKKQILAYIVPQTQGKIFNLANAATGQQAYLEFAGGAGQDVNQSQDPVATAENQLRVNMAASPTDPAAAQRAADLKARIVPGIGVAGVGQNVPEQAKDKMNSYKSLFTQMDEAKQLAKTPFSEMSYQQRQRAKTLMSNLQNKMRDADGMGVIKNAEIGVMKSLTGEHNLAGFMTKIVGTPELDELMKLKQGEYQQELSKYGIQTRHGQPAQQQSSQPQTKTYNGKTYKRGPNGEAVEVK